MGARNQLRVHQKNKPGLYVQDLGILLNYHWIRDTEIFSHERLRLQLAAMLILSGPTSSRPAALTHIKYKDITFALFPSPHGRSCFTMRVRLTETKNRAGEMSPVEYGFREEANLVYCPVTAILALAIADKAFLADIDSLGDIYSLRIRPTEDRHILLWKAEWREQYVFRKMDSSSATIPYSYNQAYDAFQRLGKSCGYARRLNFYHIRRASGKLLNEKVTQEERNQIMGHSGGSSTVFRQYYMPEFIDRDIQAIYFGTTAQDSLMRQMSRIPRNELAPTRLEDSEKEVIRNDPGLCKAISERNRCRAQIRDQYGTVTAARNIGGPAAAMWLEEYDQAIRLVCSTRAKLQRDGLASAIQKFHEQSGHEEIQRQLKGVFPNNTVTETDVIYELSEREEVAEILLSWSEQLDDDKIDLLRINLVSALSRLCHRQESTHHYRKTSRILDNTPATGIEQDKMETRDQGQTCGMREGNALSGSRDSEMLTCVFCKVDPAAGHFKRTRSYARIDSLGYHVFKQHFDSEGRYRSPTTGLSDAFDCPYEGCPKVVYGARDFAYHAHVSHSSPMFHEASIPGLTTGQVDFVP